MFNLTTEARKCLTCLDYWAARRKVLVPAITKKAADVGVDTADLALRYTQSVHDRHTSGLSIEVSA